MRRVVALACVIVLFAGWSMFSMTGSEEDIDIYADALLQEPVSRLLADAEKLIRDCRRHTRQQYGIARITREYCALLGRTAKDFKDVILREDEPRVHKWSQPVRVAYDFSDPVVDDQVKRVVDILNRVPNLSISIAESAARKDRNAAIVSSDTAGTDHLELIREGLRLCDRPRCGGQFPPHFVDEHYRENAPLRLRAGLPISHSLGQLYNRLGPEQLIGLRIYDEDIDAINSGELHRLKIIDRGVVFAPFDALNVEGYIIFDDQYAIDYSECFVSNILMEEAVKRNRITECLLRIVGIVGILKSDCTMLGAYSPDLLNTGIVMSYRAQSSYNHCRPGGFESLNNTLPYPEDLRLLEQLYSVKVRSGMERQDLKSALSTLNIQQGLEN